jgi:DNA-binding transcriptional ArsR family regulator
MKQFLKIAGALSDPTRVRAFWAVGRNEMCVCQLVELLGLAPSTISKHLSILKDAGLIDTVKRGRWIYCSVPSDPKGREIHRTAIRLMEQAGVEDEVRQDEQRISKILKEEPEELCRRQRCRK